MADTTASDIRATPARSGMRLSADERRRAVLAVAIHEFATGGMAGTSTEAIARQAGVSQPYLFRLFGSKRELFIETVRLGFRRVYETLDAASRGLSGLEAAMAMGAAYGELITDRDLLLLQIHSYAACSDAEVRTVVGDLYRALVDLVASRTEMDEQKLREFFATGMLWNVVAAIGLKEYEALGCPIPNWSLEDSE